MSLQQDILDSAGWFIGEHKTLRFQVTDNSTPPVPLDITGWVVDWKVSLTNSGDRLFTKSVGSGIALTTPLQGILDVSINAADTLTLVPGTYFYALRRTTAGSESELAYGSMVLKDVYVNYTP
jgi:hypothetical protein